MRKALREPLLHFILLAVVVFAVHRAFGPEAEPEVPSPRRIVLDDAFVDGLAERERLATGDAPADRDALERRWIRDEVLAREAVRLGLDDHDPILRRRLVQLAELWLEANVEVAEPTDEQLEFLRERDRDRYLQPATFAFSHVFFASSRETPEDDARAALGRLRDEAVESPALLGDTFLLGSAIAARTEREIAGSFGPPFASALLPLEPDVWSEPIESSYGVHLVRVTRREPQALPALDAIRARLRADWTRERTETEVRAAVTRLRGSYEIERR